MLDAGLVMGKDTGCLMRDSRCWMGEGEEGKDEDVEEEEDFWDFGVFFVLIIINFGFFSERSQRSHCRDSSFVVGLADAEKKFVFRTYLNFDDDDAESNYVLGARRDGARSPADPSERRSNS